MSNGGPGFPALRPAPRLLDRVRHSARLRHVSPRTQENYVGWIRRFILFHGKRHPDQMGAPDVIAFLSHLAVERRVEATPQNQALSALLFLYRVIFDRELEGLDAAARAHSSRPLPVVLIRDEVRDGKGGRDRRASFPTRHCAPIHHHLEHVCALHERNCARGIGPWIPGAPSVKYPNADLEWNG